MRFLAVLGLDQQRMGVHVLGFAGLCCALFGTANAPAGDDPAKPIQVKSPVRIRISDATRPLRQPASTVSRSGSNVDSAKPTAPTRNPPDRKHSPEAVSETPPASELTPATDPADRKDRANQDIRPASFKDITPGVTQAANVKKLIGAPDTEVGSKVETKLTYKIGPFPKVEITIVDDVVNSITIHLPAPTPPDEIARDLNLAAFEPVPVPDASGEILGQAYPERGILLAFVARGGEPQVAHIVLEQISAEPFILRAQHTAQRQVTRGLADLDHAQRIDPLDPRPHGMRAKLLAVLGQPTAALAAAHEAVRLDPDNAGYRLTQARYLADTGQFVRAIKETKAILDQPNLRPELHAAAECQLGDLLATGPSSDYRQAVEHQLAAIKTASPLAKDPQTATRRAAKQILLSAHLKVAQEIAAGNWQGKTDVVAQWLVNADRIARDLVENEGAPEMVHFAAQSQSLVATAALPPGRDLTANAEKTIELGRRLIAQATDPLYKQQLEWELGEVCFAATRVAQQIGNHDESLRHAQEAIALLESAAPAREVSPLVNQLMGRVYFSVGAIHAMHRSDHAEAVRWYDKALPRFAEQPAESPLAELGEHGERLVSMGVSYWQADQREPGMKLTKQGAQLIQRAVKNGTLDERSLAVPYGNLASMHEQLGNTDEARSFQSLAAKVESPDKASKQR